MARRIKPISLVRFDPQREPLEITGWLDGPATYLWIGTRSSYYGLLEGKRLFSLAKKIVKEMEGSHD